MATSVYQLGDGVRLLASFTSAGNPADPGAVAWKLTGPDGVTTTLSGVRDSLGEFHLDLITTQKGLYLWRAEGTAPVVQVVSGQFWSDERWLVTLDQLKDYMETTDDVDDGRLTQALATASAAIRSFAHRSFQSPLIVEDRTFSYDQSGWLNIDDAASVSSVILDGRYLTENLDYVLGPAQGFRTYDSQRVYEWLELPLGYGFSPEMGFMWNADTILPSRRRWSTVVVTAQWGWPIVPLDVQQAVLVTAVAFADNPRRATTVAIADFQETYGSATVDDIPLLAQNLLSNYVRR